MDVFDIHPRDAKGRPVYVVPSFTDAYELHQAASIVYTMQNREPPPGITPEQHQQRRAFFRMMSQMLVNERNRCLDKFCTHWLQHRNLPIPEYEPQSSMDLPGSPTPNEGVQGTVRNESGGS